MGVMMGYLMYYYKVDYYAELMLWNTKFWPYIVASIAAMVTGIVMSVIKHHYKQYKFEHFYIMTVGMIFILSGGIVLRNTIGKYLILALNLVVFN